MTKYCNIYLWWLLWPPYVIGQAIILLPCGFFFLSFFFFHLFSSPNLSRRRVDVYHTSTHGGLSANLGCAGLKRAAHGSLKIQDAKMVQKIAICAPSHTLLGYIFVTKACIDNWKKTC